MVRDWLKNLRVSNNLTMAEVAAKSNISESYYSLIENGHRDVPVNTAKKIAQTLNFHWTSFYNNEETA